VEKLIWALKAWARLEKDSEGELDLNKGSKSVAATSSLLSAILGASASEEQLGVRGQSMTMIGEKGEENERR